MRSAQRMLAVVFALLAPWTGTWAIQGDGLVPKGQELWPRWQGRLWLGTTAPLVRPHGLPASADTGGLKVGGMSLLGDYYIFRSQRQLAEGGGFRATSGMLLGSRATSLLSAAPAGGLKPRALSVGQQRLGSPSGIAGADVPHEDDAVPYVGIGYTGLSGKGGFSFSADLGVMGLRPDSPAELGHGGRDLDDVLREMRLSPLVQVGVSYSF